MTETLPFAAWLQNRMEALRISQSALAKALGVTHSTVSNYRLRGGIPSPAVAARMAIVLRVPRDEVYRHAGIPVDDPSTMNESGVREIDPRLVRLARTLSNRDLEMWLAIGDTLARGAAEGVESRP